MNSTEGAAGLVLTARGAYHGRYRRGARATARPRRLTRVKPPRRAPGSRELEFRDGDGHAREGIDIETMTAWQCVGCGRLEGPQNCIGVCRDRKVELVYASELAEADARLARERGRADAMRALVQKLAATRPRDGMWERSWRSIQDEARALLARDGGTGAPPSAPPAHAASGPSGTCSGT